MKNYSIEISNLQSDNENLLRENTSLKNELEFSHQQIKELEESSLQVCILINWSWILNKTKILHMIITRRLETRTQECSNWRKK